MLIGKVSPGTKVQFLDRDVYVDQAGEFVVGVGRDTPAKVVVKTSQFDGPWVDHPFSVKQREYRIQKIEGVERKYVSPPETVLARIKQENLMVKKARQTKRATREYKTGFIWPAKGPITGVYGSQRVFNGVPKRPHYGLDIAGPVGAKVIAPAAGKVTLVHKNMYYSGGTLILDHGQGVSSTFIHLHKIHVAVGQYVEQGQFIAEIGATGRVTGPHLDWRINWFNERLDPELLLPKSK